MGANPTAPRPPDALRAQWARLPPTHFGDFVSPVDRRNHRVVLAFGVDEDAVTCLAARLHDPPDSGPPSSAPAQPAALGAALRLPEVSFVHESGLRFTTVLVPYLDPEPGNEAEATNKLRPLLDALARYDGMLVGAMVVLSRRVLPHEVLLAQHVHKWMCRVSSIPFVPVMLASASDIGAPAQRAVIGPAALRQLGLSDALEFWPSDVDDALSAATARDIVFRRMCKVGLRVPLVHGLAFQPLLGLLTALVHGKDTVFVLTDWDPLEHLKRLGLDDASAKLLSEHPLLSPAYVLPVRERVLLLFGQAGSGKTSVLNALTDINCRVADSVVGVTKDFQSGQFVDFSDADGPTVFTVVDTAGLGEAQAGTVDNDDAVRLLLDVLARFNGSLNGLMFAFDSRIKDSDVRILSLFSESVCGDSVPLVMLSTKFTGHDASAWKAENEPIMRTRLRLKFADVEPVQFIDPRSPFFNIAEQQRSLASTRRIIMINVTPVGCTLPRADHPVGFRIARFFFKLRHPNDPYPSASSTVVATLKAYGLTDAAANALALHPLFQ